MDEKRNLHSFLDQYLLLSAEPFIFSGSNVVKLSVIPLENYNTDCMFASASNVTSSKTLFFLLMIVKSC